MDFVTGNSRVAGVSISGTGTSDLGLSLSLSWSLWRARGLDIHEVGGPTEIDRSGRFKEISRGWNEQQGESDHCLYLLKSWTMSECPTWPEFGAVSGRGFRKLQSRPDTQKGGGKWKIIFNSLGIVLFHAQLREEMHWAFVMRTSLIGHPYEWMIHVRVSRTCRSGTESPELGQVNGIEIYGMNVSRESQKWEATVWPHLYGRLRPPPRSVQS